MTTRPPGNKKPAQSEAAIKQACQALLQLEKNAGRLHWDRLNSGSVLVKKGERTYRIQLCEEGTWDTMIVVRGQLIYVEYKTTTGKLRPAQVAFRDRLQRQGAQCWLIRDADDLRLRLQDLYAWNSRVLA